MHLFILIVLVVLTALLPFFLYRAVKGPNVFDRLIGLNGIATKSVILLVIIGATFSQLEMFIDIALGYGLLNLVSSVAVGKYLEKKGMGS